MKHFGPQHCGNDYAGMGSRGVRGRPHYGYRKWDSVAESISRGRAAAAMEARLKRKKK